MTPTRLLILLVILGIVAVIQVQQQFNRDEHNSNSQTTSSITKPPAQADVEVKTAPIHTTQTQVSEINISEVDLSKTHPDTHTDNRPFNPIDQIRAIQNKTDFQESLVNEHDAFQRYPGHNRPFPSPEKDPILSRYKSFERTSHSDDKSRTLTIWSDQKYYLAGQTSRVFAVLRDGEGNTVATQFAGQLIFNEQRNLGPIEFNVDEGLAYSEIVLTEDMPAGVYKVLIANQDNDLADALTFTLSKPEASLTGEFKDSITETGDLKVEVEVEIKQNQRYYLEASLYSSTNDAIGTSQTAEDLKPGKHWLPLEFHGLLIRDAEEPGPYVMKHIALAKVAVPIQRAPLQAIEHTTADYQLEQFSNLPYGQHSQGTLQQ